MQPSELINKHIELVEQMVSTTFVPSIWRAVDPDAYLGSALGAATRQAANEAHCYRVSPDMGTYVQYAASLLDDSDTWDATLAPTRAGLVRFESPLLMVDIHGDVAKVHWLLWGPVDQGNMIFMFNDHADPDDFSGQYLQGSTPEHRHLCAVLGNWGAVIGQQQRNGNRIGPALAGPPPDVAVDLLNQGYQPLSTTNMSRIVHALWLMLDQTVTVKDEDGRLPTEHVRRTSQKAAQARGLNTTVTVIELRRRASRGGASSEFVLDRTHRWLTRAHWKWQRYGPGLSRSKRILIDEYISGPDDKPLVISKKVYDLKR